VLGDYLPDYAFLAYLEAPAQEQVKALPFVRWVGIYQPAYKLAASVDLAEGSRSYRVLLAPWADQAALQKSLTAIDSDSRSFEGGISAVLGGDQIIQLAHQSGVVWIEPYTLQRLHNDVGGGTIMGGSTAWSNGYTGAGVVVAVADTGLDTGNPASIHQDFQGRVQNISSWPVQNIAWAPGCSPSNIGDDDGAADVDSGHGSHVAGSVAGNGARSSGQFKGLAYQAGITFQAIEQYTDWPTSCPPSLTDGFYLTGIPDDVRELLTQVYNWGARIQNNSWGGGDFGDYDTQASYFDDFVYENPDMAVVVSAGNSGDDANSDGYVDENSISSPGTAKNTITVGASDNERASGGYAPYTWEAFGFYYNPTASDYISDNRQELAAFSSRGPMEDGRIKPDIVAPGTNILSVRSVYATGDGWGGYNEYYMYNGGTSMASPLTAGAAALVRDYYIDGEGHANPSAALIKATLINSAVDILGYGNTSQEAGKPIPNNHEGWGLVNVAAATTPNKRLFFDETAGLATGAKESYYFNVKAGTPFKVSLVWSDAAGSPASGAALVNNLNLRLTAPNGTTMYWGNIFSGGWSQTGGSADVVNNVENAYIQSPTQGLWLVEVIGQNVPSGPQPYALVVNGDIDQSEPLSVTGIAPERGFNNGPLSNVLIQGTGFDALATVELRLGAQVIPGTNLVVNPDTDRITARFNLTGATPGQWDVRVNNPDENATLADAFYILDATLPEVAISKTTDQLLVQPGSYLTYTISITNHGLVSATGSVFTDVLPSGVIFDSLTPTCEGGLQPLPVGFTCPIQPVTLTAGSSVTYTLVVSVPDGLEGLLSNYVEIASLEEDGYPTNNNDTMSSLVGQLHFYLPIVARQIALPGVPILAPISNADIDGNYTVSWQAGAGPVPTSYDIRENGAIILSSYPSTSYNVTNKAPGTYTYQVRAKNAGGDSDWSTQQSVLVGTLLKNGNFENGRDGSWQESSTHNYELVTNSFAPNTVQPHSGVWGAWLGGDNDEVSTLTQQVTVPPGRTTLGFWYWLFSGENTCGYDLAYVRVNNIVVDTFNVCSANNTNAWVKRFINLSAYSGQTISLQFYMANDSMLLSNWFLDDVAFE